MISDGSVTVDGKKTKPSFQLSEGDLIAIAWPRPSKKEESLGSLVLYEDRDVIAVSKPAGLMVHPLSPSWEKAPSASYAGEKTLVSMLLSFRPELASSGVDRLGLVHRLDRGTSGVIVAAKTPSAQKSLMSQFRDREVGKIYIGAVKGEVKKDEGIIDAPLGRISGSMKICVSGLGRPALTEFRVLSRKNGYSLLELYPKTGRTNQLRVHLSWIGHPVVGDTLYSGGKASRLMLHSGKIVFKHPSTGRKKSIECPLPEDFRKEWKTLTGEKL